MILKTVSHLSQLFNDLFLLRKLVQQIIPIGHLKIIKIKTGGDSTSAEGITVGFVNGYAKPIPGRYNLLWFLSFFQILANG